MAKARKKRKTVELVQLEQPTPEQLVNGSFNRDYVTHAETNTKAMAYRRNSYIIEKWLDEGEPLFPVPAQRFIDDCITLWSKVREPRVISLYGERMPTQRGNGSLATLEALDQLSRFKGLLGPYQRHFWSVFENVVRFNEPAGIAGSRFATNPQQRIQSAKMIVSAVACDLAGKLGY